LSIPLITGRSFDDRDTVDAPRVALINQAAARRFYPNQDPTGKRISFGCKEGLCRTIVGVVGNIKQESLTAAATPEIYVPYLQMPTAGMTLFVHSTSDPLALVGPLRNQMRELDQDQPLYSIRTLDQRLSESMAQPRSLMWLFSGFAVLALALTMVGIYGVVSFSVTQRTHEIGIRMALGAERRNVLGLIVGQGLKLVGVGLALGALAAFALTRLMAKLLFGVSATDPITFVVVALLLALVALVASYIPARRATKVDPLVALRYE
jgi:putative ABC transport system permease protein